MKGNTEQLGQIVVGDITRRMMMISVPVLVISDNLLMVILTA